MTAFDGFWYRAEVRHYSVADEWGDHLYTSTDVVWSKFAVHHETPKGVFLVEVPQHVKDRDHHRGKDLRNHLFGAQFVRGTARRQRACPTRETALADCIARKTRHVDGCKARLARAEADLHLLQNYQLRAIATA